LHNAWLVEFILEDRTNNRYCHYDQLLFFGNYSAAPHLTTIRLPCEVTLPVLLDLIFCAYLSISKNYFYYKTSSSH